MHCVCRLVSKLSVGLYITLSVFFLFGPISVLFFMQYGLLVSRFEDIFSVCFFMIYTSKYDFFLCLFASDHGVPRYSYLIG